MKDLMMIPADIKKRIEPLQELMDKEHKTTLTDAQDAIFAAEKSLYANEGVRDTDDEYHKLQEVINHFKMTLLGKDLRTDAVSTELDILRDKQETFLRKVESVRETEREEREHREEEERKKKEEPDRVEGEPSETQPHAHYVTVWEVVHADGPPPP